MECPAGENNTWNLNLDLTENDFESLDDPSMTVTGKDLSTIAGILGPRNADGSIPDVSFLKLKKGSRAIDKGEDLGFPFVGKAPDLGAFEYGLSSNSAQLSSSNSATSSSSAAGSSSGTDAFIATPRNGHLPALHNARGAALVFDMQGRYLGTIQSELLRFGTIAEVLRTKFRTPGAYIVRQGNSLKKVK